MKKWSKNASLNLSINAIVIVVLAMTLLGLGLGFIRGMFSQVTGISEATFEKISEQLNTDLATSEAPLLFSKSRATMERGDVALEAVGVRNDGDSGISYGIKVITANCPDDAEEDGECPDVGKNWFEYFKGPGQYTLPAAQRAVNKVQINIPNGANTGLYLLKIFSYTGDVNDNAPEGVQECSGIDNCEVIGQTEFFLTVA